MPDQKELLRAEMDRQGVTDNELRAGIMALCGGESAFKPRHETPYTNTTNVRIRSIFRSSLGDKPDRFIDDLKRDPVRFFNHVYGPEGAGPRLGNIGPDDGYRFRGRGFLQLTGRSNYLRYASLTGLDLIGHPDLANEPEAAAAIAVAYMRDRYDGGGWEAMKAAVGNSFGNVDEEKNRLFRQYRESGEFDYRPSGAGPTGEAANNEDIENAVRLLQAALADGGYNPGPVDGIAGKRTLAALARWRAER